MRYPDNLSSELNEAPLNEEGVSSFVTLEAKPIIEADGG